MSDSDVPRERDEALGLRARASQPAEPAGMSGVVALQCAAAVAGTLIGESLGPSLAAKLVAGMAGAAVGAFLTAPGRHHRRRIVAVALLLALLAALRRAGEAVASERNRSGPAWLPASWSAVGVAAVVGFVLGGAVTTATNGWTSDRSSALVEIPDVRGKSRAAALDVVRDSGIRPAALEEPSETIAAGSATRTDPPHRTRVQEDARVSLFISTGRPAEDVVVPDVGGLARASARRLLVDVGLRPRIESEVSTVIAAGIATRTQPPAGSEVERGARVTLVVSSGEPTAPVEVPDVAGKPRAEAIALLRAAELLAREQSRPSASVAEGIAVGTVPAAGSSVSGGDTVTLVLSSGSKVTVPDVVGDQENDAFSALKAAGLEPSINDQPAEVADGTVLSTDPPAGAKVELGSPVTMSVSSGPDRPAPPAGTSVDPGSAVTLFIACHDCPG